MVYSTPFTNFRIKFDKKNGIKIMRMLRQKSHVIRIRQKGYNEDMNLLGVLLIPGTAKQVEIIRICSISLEQSMMNALGIICF